MALWEKKLQVMTLGYSNQIWYGKRELVLKTCKRDSWVWDMELWKNIRAAGESFFEQVMYVARVGHCIGFVTTLGMGILDPLKDLFKRSLVKLKKMLGSH